jgi:hypothetical protein
MHGSSTAAAAAAAAAHAWQQHSSSSSSSTCMAAAQQHMHGGKMSVCICAPLQAGGVTGVSQGQAQVHWHQRLQHTDIHARHLSECILCATHHQHVRTAMDVEIQAQMLWCQHLQQHTDTV